MPRASSNPGPLGPSSNSSSNNNINGMMHAPPAANSRPTHSRSNSLRSRYVDPLSSMGSTPASTTPNTPTKANSFSNLIPGTNTNNFGSFNNGLVPAASMFMPMPVKPAGDGDASGEASAEAGGSATLGAPMPTQPAFFMPAPVAEEAEEAQRRDSSGSGMRSAIPPAEPTAYADADEKATTAGESRACDGDSEDVSSSSATSPYTGLQQDDFPQQSGFPPTARHI